MTLRNSKILVLIVAVGSLAACASKPQRAETRESQSRQREVAQAPRRDAGTTSVVVERDTRDTRGEVTSGVSVASYDYSRRADYQSALTARVEAARREISSLRSASAPRSDCERRMRYLESVGESAMAHIASLTDVGADQWSDKSAGAGEAVAKLETYLANDRSECMTGGTTAGSR